MIRADSGPSLERLKSSIRKVEERGFSYTVYADASSKYVMDHVTALPLRFADGLRRGRVPMELKDLLHEHGFTRPPAASFRKTGKGCWKIEGEGDACSIYLRREKEEDTEEIEERLDLYDLTGPETKEYERMVEEGIIREVPGGKDADIWILLRAKSNPDSRILSNDSFKDWERIFPFVREEERTIRFEAKDHSIVIQW
ncbi:hypothetical protein AKJ39_01505 [candidate division MSBL1 archaeon SCGC-AAA259J03]|uniref:Uncharacterized protein n=1 Tax=candidate division MSBL1 archaeon SCGC-AAA259J03 TaxID=1698269 RepID=A0A656YWM5_9EURY|nr:hypothetical protein AKJ39_01505 [candidate division MSBL1 archaeon SCGC-AAA259J03]